MDNQVLGYKDLAAIPKDKAILDIERPDLMIYEPHFTYSLLEHVELPRSREVRGGGRLRLPEGSQVSNEWGMPLADLGGRNGLCTQERTHVLGKVGIRLKQDWGVNQQEQP